MNKHILIMFKQHATVVQFVKITLLPRQEGELSNYGKKEGSVIEQC